ncbi:MAG: PAS domain-containing protein [Proteobacteria bacterium]|nr:PAS domain-containing protein [Pseudomonadota bacterium]
MKMIHHEDFRQFPPLLIEENAASPAPVRPELDSAFLHDLFDNLSQALLIVSNAGTILDANRSATTVARTRLDELLGRPLKRSLPGSRHQSPWRPRTGVRCSGRKERQLLTAPAMPASQPNTRAGDRLRGTDRPPIRWSVGLGYGMSHARHPFSPLQR